ncbi:hypothetical protein EXN66_Car008098 [Channa argus]|uniref:Uncharacterized protein n=1 Tax=Channa argus TaxID=215402 RepID=A0A6G1PQ77_CHAAH|nr:hypothetical protein EXN66_Car008098 [Channa argus]
MAADARSLFALCGLASAWFGPCRDTGTCQWANAAVVAVLLRHPPERRLNNNNNNNNNTEPVGFITERETREGGGGGGGGGELFSEIVTDCHKWIIHQPANRAAGKAAVCELDLLQRHLDARPAPSAAPWPVRQCSQNNKHKMESLKDLQQQRGSKIKDAQSTLVTVPDSSTNLWDFVIKFRKVHSQCLFLRRRLFLSAIKFLQTNKVQQDGVCGTEVE